MFEPSTINPLAQSQAHMNYQDIEPPYDVNEEIKQDYKLLNDDTLNELEEINPEDPYFYDKRFNVAVEAFFDEADFEDAFNWRIQDIEPQKVFTTIQKVRNKCKTEQVFLNELISKQTQASNSSHPWNRNSAF